jgi:ketosteroid isomerase-like protein
MMLATAEACAEATLDRWYAAWNAHDVAGIATLFTDDVVYEDPTAPEPIIHGRGAVEALAAGLFAAMPDLRLERLEIWVSEGGGVIASAFRFTATLCGPSIARGLPAFAPTDSPVEFLGMDRSALREDRLARHQIFMDTVEVGRQIGAFPTRGSALDKLSRRAQHLTARRMRRQVAAR